MHNKALTACFKKRTVTGRTDNKKKLKKGGSTVNQHSPAPKIPGRWGVPAVAQEKKGNEKSRVRKEGS